MSDRNANPGTLHYGDCLDVMREWPDSFVDLCYLDPPFNSKADYNILFGGAAGADKQQTLAFTDTWHWDVAAAERTRALKRASANPARDVVAGLHTALGDCGMMAYLSYMAERLVEVRRVLKDTGSIYLHCDPTAGAYLKVVMDAVFGHANFRNEIAWRIGWISGFKSQKRGWIRNHDTLLYYVRSPAAVPRFNKEYIPYPPDYVRRDGKKPTGKGVPVEDTWNCSSADVLDSIMIKSFSTEKLGYPTQKPLALLERIVRASSSKGDLVLDPFCGCGTTIAAADRLGRHWLGIDISPFAIDLVKNRRMKSAAIEVRGVPVDVETARKMAANKPFDFEKWAVTRVPGMTANRKQVGDGGVDGRGYLLASPDESSGLVLAQVKGGKFVKSQLRDFLHTVRREGAALGVYITTDEVTSGGALAEASGEGHFEMGASRYPKVQIWSIEDYFAGRKPDLPPLADPFTGKPMEPDLFGDRS